MKFWKYFVLALVCMLFVGCGSTELSSVLRWSKTDVGIGARSVGEVAQILWLAQEESKLLDSRSIWVGEVEESFLSKMEVEEQWADSLFLSTWWLENSQDLVEGKLICAKLSFAISESRPYVSESFNIVAEGDARVEAIFSGMYSSELSKEFVDELATRIVRAVVTRLNELLNEVAEGKNAWATILSYDETK